MRDLDRDGDFISYLLSSRAPMWNTFWTASDTPVAYEVNRVLNLEHEIVIDLRNVIPKLCKR